MSRRVIFDTSTLVSAALRPGSVPHQALLKALATCDLCASTETLGELEQVLNLEKFDRYLDRRLRQEFITLVRRSIHLFAVGNEIIEAVDPSCRDPKDNKFLALALVAENDVLISSDEDLLVMHPWHKMAILRPGEFLAQATAPSEPATDI